MVQAGASGIIKATSHKPVAGLKRLYSGNKLQVLKLQVIKKNGAGLKPQATSLKLQAARIQLQDCRTWKQMVSALREGVLLVHKNETILRMPNMEW